ncbi:MAG: ankyrin repeat domain-containing protein [Bacteroidales bacterium]|nr:ankyrin repeat domain-containing protein [Bacteroidales bacterium]
MKYKTAIAVVLSILLIAFTGCNTRSESKKGVENPVTGEVQAADTAAVIISFHEAALNGQINQVIKLLNGGFDVDIRDEDGRTALMYAAFNGHTEILKKLIERGAQVNLRDNYGRTALMMASSGPNPAAVKLLLDHEAAPDLADAEEHFTALMYAAAEGHMDVVKVLLSFRANPELKDVDGDDAQAFAVKNGHKEIAILLQSYKK